MTTTTSPGTRAGAPGLPGAGLDVAVFITCINDILFPQTGIAMTKLLERLGCRVHFPREQTCCAQITTNTGYFTESMDMVESYVKAFSDYDYVDAPTGSCIAAVRDQHPMLAEHAGDQGLMRDVEHTSSISLDISEFLVDVLGVTDVGAYFPHLVTLHPSCHGMRLLKLGDRPYRLLENVRGMTTVDLPAAEQCCGFGGTFCVKNPDMSSTMAADKARHIRETGAEYVVGWDNSCLLNIGGVLSRQNAGVKTIHLVEVLANTEED